MRRRELPFVIRKDYADRVEFTLWTGETRVVWRDGCESAGLSAKPTTEPSGLIRYVLAQVAVVAGLVHGIVENDPYFVVGSVVLCTASCVWFIRKMLRRERNAK